MLCEGFRVRFTRLLSRWKFSCQSSIVEQLPMDDGALKGCGSHNPMISFEPFAVQ
jgi:hypothetical protein